MPTSLLASASAHIHRALTAARARGPWPTLLGLIKSPTFVSAVLAGALAVEIVGTINGVVRLLAGAPRDSATATRSIGGLPVRHSFAALAAANLFGNAASEAPTPPPSVVTREQLVLVGTLVVSDPSQASAIIGTQALRPVFHVTGSVVAPGITLREVYTDHAVVDRGGQTETVWMPRSVLTFASAPRALGSPATVQVAEEEEPEPQQPKPPPVAEVLDYENARVGSAFKETALTSNGVFMGLIVQAGPDPSVLQQMGLKPGDVIKGVDGILIDIDQVDRLRKALAKGGKVQLDVIRPEGPVDVQIDATSFQGLVSN
jgi:general secretion pathway protein C